jgi:hypothetical protein
MAVINCNLDRDFGDQNLITMSLNWSRTSFAVVSSLSIKKARQTNKPKIQRPINGLRMPLKSYCLI